MLTPQNLGRLDTKPQPSLYRPTPTNHGPLPQQQPRTEERQPLAHATVTTAKSQAMAVRCAGIVRWSGTHCCPSMVLWAQSPSLFREWAEDWVLRPACAADFVLPIEGIKDNEKTKRVQHHLHVCVSHTLGIVGYSCYTCGDARSYTFVVGCLGMDRVLCKRFFQATRWQDSCLYEYFDMDVSEYPHSAENSVGIFTSEYGTTVKCSGNWIVALDTRSVVLRVWKVVGGVPCKPEVYFEDGIEVGMIDFSPLCDDILIILTRGSKTTAATVKFVDLAESFKIQDIVFTLRITCSEPRPLGVLWKPDGSMCTLHHENPEPFHLVECTTGHRHYSFPRFYEVTPIGRSHAVVCFLFNPKAFEVYHTGNLSRPEQCFPCTWARASKQSGLVASTSHQESDSNVTEISFQVHDCVTGFHVGDFIVHLDKTGCVILLRKDHMEGTKLGHDLMIWILSEKHSCVADPLNQLCLEERGGNWNLRVAPAHNIIVQWPISSSQIVEIRPLILPLLSIDILNVFSNFFPVIRHVSWLYHCSALTLLPSVVGSGATYLGHYQF
ncbi:hypothetical protein Pelo_1900 [Pelomyxa schiedti]|nr:hypothetical protein Pelo_1900 [Pelomyxa schiedti]